MSSNSEPRAPFTPVKVSYTAQEWCGLAHHQLLFDAEGIRETLHSYFDGEGDRSGTLPYPRDGVIFGNYEKRLPPRPRGYYHEYTVPTPGSRNRGARRIIVGTPDERYFTADHYRSFRRIRE